MGKKWEKKQKPNSQKFFAGSGGFSSKLSIIPWNDVKLEGYNRPELEKVTIEASCPTGFEGAVADEVKKRLNGENVIEIMGRVLFDVPIQDLKKVMELRTVDHIFVIIGATMELDLSQPEEQSLDTLTDFVLDKIDWKKGLESWNRVFEFFDLSEDLVDQAKRLKLDKNPNFRCTCYRTGENIHKFTSMDVAKHVGGQIQNKFGWGVKMTGFDIEVVVNIDSNQVYCGIGLTHQSLHKRNIEHFGPTTLRATICASMLQLANVQPGDLVCDPMCGGGSIPIEGAISYKQGFYFAGDMHEKAVERTRDNLKTFDSKIPSDGIQWDVTNIPLRDNCLDVLITDLPFGKRSGSKADNRVLYPKTLISMARVVKPNTGRAVLLTQDKTSMFKCAGQFNKFWKINKQMYCNIGGLAALVFLMTRTEEMP